MSVKKKFDVLIPDEAQLSELDTELLSAVFEAIISLRTTCHRGWEKNLEQLENDGWKVKWGLRWEVEAKRARAHESASGKTLEDAFNQLTQLSRLHHVQGCP
jgi:hypothetical protein